MNAPNISFSSPSSIFPSIRKPICPLHLICHKLKHGILFGEIVSSVQTPLLSHCHCITSTVLLDSPVHLIMETDKFPKQFIWNTPQTMNNVQHNICINTEFQPVYNWSQISQKQLFITDFTRNNYFHLPTFAAISFIMHSVTKQGYDILTLPMSYTYISQVPFWLFIL